MSTYEPNEDRKAEMIDANKIVVCEESPAQDNKYDYGQIASLHRLSTSSIMIFILAGVVVRNIFAVSDRMVANTTELTEGVIFALLVFFCGAILILAAVSFSSYCMVRLASSLRFKSGAIVLQAILLPLPFLCLVPLFVVYFRA